MDDKEFPGKKPGNKYTRFINTYITIKDPMAMDTHTMDPLTFNHSTLFLI